MLSTTVHIITGRSLRWLALPAMVAASGCSQGVTPASHFSDPPPEIKAILDSDKSPKEKKELIAAKLLHRDSSPKGAKSKVNRPKSPGRN